MFWIARSIESIITEAPRCSLRTLLVETYELLVCLEYPLRKVRAHFRVATQAMPQRYSDGRLWNVTGPTFSLRTRGETATQKRQRRSTRVAFPNRTVRCSSGSRSPDSCRATSRAHRPG